MNKKQIDSGDAIKEKIVDLSCGLVASIVDMLLFSVAFSESTISSSNKSCLRKLNKSMEEASVMGIDKEAVKRAIHKATHRRYIKRIGRESVAITDDGWKKINSLFPVYQSRREWDGRVYLVTYDIPEKKKKKREELRRLVVRLGGGLLQESVWVCLYDPKSALKRFAQENLLQGMIIVSDLGKEGAIGEEDLDDLINRVFKLEPLNNKYSVFINSLREGKLLRHEAIFIYLSILRDDPQLPFELLPYNWQGDKAYGLVKKYYPF